ncbi:hypothetical protein [Paenibacillus polymyxa]|uniref:hypothetical protein n=2 Tax=Paenibacillus polymyxa TaxID=1406 RepID=UPI0025B6C5B7|nr:hypothetical protein [Paenibacillus polymyxa]
MIIFEKLEFSANPRAVRFMPYGAFFEPHAAPSSHLIVRKSSLPRSRSLLIHTRRGNTQIVHRVYQYPLNIGFDKGSSGAESGGTADFLLASRNPTASLTSMGGTSLVQPPNPIPNPLLNQRPSSGGSSAASIMKQRSRKQRFSCVERCSLLSFTHGSRAAARQRIAACDQPGKRSGDLAKAIDIVGTCLKRRRARLERCCCICSAGLLLPMKRGERSRWLLKKKRCFGTKNSVATIIP